MANVFCVKTFAPRNSSTRLLKNNWNGQVYWEGAARDRAYMEAYPAKKHCKMASRQREGSASPGGATCGHHPRRNIMRISVRVPTLAVVDAQAACVFAERLVQQVVIVLIDADGKGTGGVTLGQHHQQRQQRMTMKLRLVGVDARSCNSAVADKRTLH